LLGYKTAASKMTMMKCLRPARTAPSALLLSLLLSLAARSGTSAFGIVGSIGSLTSTARRSPWPRGTRCRTGSGALSLRMSDGGDASPSDTSGEDGYDDFYQYQDVVGVAATDYEPTTQEEALVSNVMDLMPADVGEVVSGETRAAINEALMKLERLNPTKDQPTVSPLLNGVWSLRYVGGYAPEGALPSPTREFALFLYSGGYSPGIFALSLAQKIPAAVVDVGDLEVAISRPQPRVEASVDVKVPILGETTVKVVANLEVESDVRLRETYVSATVLGRDVEIPSALRYSRDLYVTYLDDDLLIVRDASGVPEVLTRKEKIFSQNWGTEPSALDDMVPPGEGEEM